MEAVRHLGFVVDHSRRIGLSLFSGLYTVGLGLQKLCWNQCSNFDNIGPTSFLYFASLPKMCLKFTSRNEMGFGEI